MRGTEFLTLLAAAGGLYAQVAAEANTAYRTETDRKGVVTLLSDPTRDERQKPRELVQAMGLQRGMTVADIGTGVGFMLPFLSRAVGPNGKVIAEDIFDDFLAGAKDKAAKHNLTNVTFVKGTESDPMLPEGQVDQALLMDSYHHFDYPERMLAAVRRSLKPGGKMVLVEYHKSETAMPNGRALTHIRLDKAGFTKEIEANGFRLVAEREHVPGSTYMLIFEMK
jgi:predicted methyltransferase